MLLWNGKIRHIISFVRVNEVKLEFRSTFRIKLILFYLYIYIQGRCDDVIEGEEKSSFIDLLGCIGVVLLAAGKIILAADAS